MHIPYPSCEWFSCVALKATLESDSAEIKTRKCILTMVVVIISFLAIFWGLAYVLLGKPYSGAIPLGYAFISSLSITYYFFTKKFEFFRFSQLLLIFLLPFFLMWSLGGFAHGSVVMIWAFFTPLAAMMFVDTQHASKWLIAFLVFTAFSAAIDQYLKNTVIPMDEMAIKAFFVLNMGFGFVAIFVVLNFFVQQREKSHHAAVQAKIDLQHINDQLQENEIKIHHLMLTDGLTGVSNRRHLDERLQAELKRIQRYGHVFSVVMADLDYFKQVNDTYGHLKGDEVIKTFVDIINNSIRTADFVARFGGEEFFIILPETDLSGATLLAERICESFQKTCIQDIKGSLTASFGVTEAEKNDYLEGLVQRVDQALYQAKSAGRNCVISI